MDDATNLSPEERASDQKPKAFYRVERCFAWAIFLAAASLFILTGSSNAFVPAALGCIWAVMIRSKMKKGGEPVQESIKRMMIFLLISAFSQLFAPLHVGETGAWRYPVIKGYIEAYNTTDIPDWLPDKIPAGAEDHRLDYLPSVMQGNGHFSLRFKCGGEELDRLESLGREKAKYIIPLADYIEKGGDISVSGYEVSPAYEISGDGQGTLSDVRYDSEFWQGYEDGAEILVISASLDSHKPHSEVMIINRESGMVQLFAD